MTDDTVAASAAAIANDGERLRDLVAAHVTGGRTDEMIAAAQALLDREPGLRTFRYLRKLSRGAKGRTGLKAVKIALLSSFSIEFIQDAFAALGFARGLEIEFFQSGFGAYRQALLDPDGPLYRFAPDVIVLAIEGSNLIPEVYDAYAETSEDARNAAADRLSAEMGLLIATVRQRSTAPLLIHNLAIPAYRPLGIADVRTYDGQGEHIARLNATLAALARDADGVYIVDYAALVSRHGARNWYDDRMRLYARSPIANAMLPELAAEYLKFVCAFAGLAKKCLVVDLDNTLWGGVVGEDGLAGIRLGADYPGNAYVEFQRYLLGLSRRGVLLAIASKNNPEDVDEVFATHRSMVLGPQHFAAREVHWEPKSRSLARIAQRLAIGLEHMVFADDNPAECAEVRGVLPMVRVIELPPQPERYVPILQEAALFETLAVSAEDLRRSDLYRQRAAAETARADSIGSIEDYYRDLAMELTVAPVEKATLARTAELIRKTNQFNVTTVRHSEAEVAKRSEDPRWIVATFRVTDRFGDNGIVGVVMAEQIGEIVDVDTLLMSCRVIGRTVETAMLAYLCDEARRRGAKAIRARIVPTAKNIPVRSLFSEHQFTKVDEDASGTTKWQLRLDDGCVVWPTWFKRVA